ncbi:MAG: transglycosylase SLT domain-containing protein [Desulfobulbales bacterium]
MKLVSKLLLIFFMLGLVSVCLPQKVLAVSDEGITSFQVYQPKANQGDADAQFNLALLYYTGLGIPQDRRYAIYWYTKAAEQGHVQAQYYLGKLYNFGYGEEVRQDFKLAVYWLTKASEQGLVQAQYLLGHMYEYDDEPPQDYKQAFFWYTKAAEQNHYFAKEDRDRMLEKMSQSQIEEAQKFSKELYEKIDNEIAEQERYSSFINAAAKRYNLTPELIQAIIKIESSFNPFAISERGAMGLMQLMPETAKEMNVEYPFEAEENIMGGSRYLRKLHDLFAGDLQLVLAAYNAGPNRILENNHRIPRIPETEEYVKKVLQEYGRIRENALAIQ